MKIIGIDTGLRVSGYGVVEARGRELRVVDAGIVRVDSDLPFPQRLDLIYQDFDGLLSEHEPEMVAIEELYAHYKHPMTASILGHVRGVICLLCAENKIELVECSVKRIRKALTGNGNATKVQTQKMVVHTLRIDGSNLTLDASDALALALGYIHLHRH